MHGLRAHAGRRRQAAGADAGDGPAAELERVLYAQQLALFAPHAAPAAAHLPLLLATLRSRQPALRRAAAATLRHLAGAGLGRGENARPAQRCCAAAPLLLRARFGHNKGHLPHGAHRVMLAAPRHEPRCRERRVLYGACRGPGACCRYGRSMRGSAAQG